MTTHTKAKPDLIGALNELQARIVAERDDYPDEVRHNLDAVEGSARQVNSAVAQVASRERDPDDPLGT